MVVRHGAALLAGMTKSAKQAREQRRVVIRTLTSEPKHVDARPKAPAKVLLTNKSPKLKQDNAAERPKAPAKGQAPKGLCATIQTVV